MADVRRVFTVDGKPFFTLGGQSKNSSGYNRAEAARAFEVVKLLHGNTLEIPVYWNQVEPVEGQFDFSSVAEILAAAREHGLRLILLWFATWKNGDMDYAPAWVKTDPSRFKRVISPTGKSIWVLSSHCRATLEADRRACVELCKYLKAHDGDTRTVIALQLENEPGILGSDRDYGAEAQAEFDGPVPSELVARLKEAGQGTVYDLWREAGSREAGSWPELFGWSAGEVMTSWSIARYIDAIAAAAKAVYDIPMYVNVWLGEQGWRLPGESYPSGGAVGKTLDVYKWCAPHVDLIAPDIYIPDADGYREICAIYARPDNPLFVPESGRAGSNAWNMFRAIAEHDAIGYHCFGIEEILDETGAVRPGCAGIVGSFRCVAAAIPLLLKYQGTGRVHAVVQEEHQLYQKLDLEGYHGLVQFGEGLPAYAGKDWRHPAKRPPFFEQSAGERGRGLVFQTGEHEFYVVGAAFRLHLRRKTSPEQALDVTSSNQTLFSRQVHYVSVDEGHFDDEGEFVIDRRRNGDEVDHGVWVEPDVSVVRVVLTD